MDEYEPTLRLRWLQHPTYRDMLTGAPVTPRVLQQQFVRLYMGIVLDEWRDVPTEME